MLSRELQKGVATCCSRNSVMIVFTALQLMFRSSTGDAKAAAASATKIDRYVGAMLEVNENDTTESCSNTGRYRLFMHHAETSRPREYGQPHGEGVCSTDVESAWTSDWHFTECCTVFGLSATRPRRPWKKSCRSYRLRLAVRRCSPSLLKNGLMYAHGASRLLMEGSDRARWPLSW